MKPFFIPLTFLFSFFTHSVFAKDHTFTLKVANLPATEIELTLLKGDRHVPIDTVVATNKGEVVFTMKQDYLPGMYSVTVQRMPIWQFIYNAEDISAEIALGAPMESVRITQSNENTSYYNFLRQQNKVEIQIDVVRAVIDTYPVSEQFHTQAMDEYRRLADAHEQAFRAVMSAKGNSLAKVFAGTVKSMIVPLEIPDASKTEYAKEHYFDFVPFNDTMVIYSDLLSSKLLKYYAFYADKEGTKSANTQAYIQGTDSILSKALPYPVVYNFVANYLIDGFEGIGQESVADHIAEQYAEINSCEKKSHMSSIETKVYNRTKLRVGTDAPHFELQNEKSSYSFSGETDKTIVLAFWATWCQHCTEVMPKTFRSLAPYMKQGVDVVTVSLDKDKDDWKSFSEAYHLNDFSNFCPEGDWDAKMVVDYAVYGTPSFYVIHKGKIVAKPLDLEQIPQILSELKNK